MNFESFCYSEVIKIGKEMLKDVSKTLPNLTNYRKAEMDEYYDDE